KARRARVERSCVHYTRFYPGRSAFPVDNPARFPLRSNLVPKNADFTARDGAELQYTLHASSKPGVPRLVLVHSLALDRSVWDGVVAALGDRADVLTY